MGDIEELRRENRRRIVPSSHDVPRPRYESFMTDTLRHALTADGWNQSDSAVYRKIFVSSWLGACEYSLTVAPFDTILGGIEVSMFAMVGRMSAGETADAFGGMGLLDIWSTDVLGEYGVVRSSFGGEHPNVLGQQLADDLALWMAIRSGSDDPASMPGPLHMLRPRVACCMDARPPSRMKSRGGADANGVIMNGASTGIFGTSTVRCSTIFGRVAIGSAAPVTTVILRTGCATVCRGAHRHWS